jgi:hypothetical protein
MAEYENTASEGAQPLREYPNGPRKDEPSRHESAMCDVAPSLHSEIKDRLNAERIRTERDTAMAMGDGVCEHVKEFNPTGSDILRSHINNQRQLTRKLAQHAEKVSLACYELDHLLEIMPNLNPNTPAGRGWKRIVEFYRRHEVF